MGVAAALAAAAAMLAGCSGGQDDGAGPPPNADAFEMRPVILMGPLPFALDESQEGWLEGVGVEDPADAIAEAGDMAVWLAEGDCDAPAPEATERIAVGCAPLRTLVLAGPPILGGEDVASMRYEPGDDGQDIIYVTFTDAGASAFAQATEDALNRPPGRDSIAMFVDGDVLAAPTVMSVIDNGEVAIVAADLSDDAAILGLTE